MTQDYPTGTEVRVPYRGSEHSGVVADREQYDGKGIPVIVEDVTDYGDTRLAAYDPAVVTVVED